jgi:hypothetical protein
MRVSTRRDRPSSAAERHLPALRLVAVLLLAHGCNGTPASEPDDASAPFDAELATAEDAQLRDAGTLQPGQDAELEPAEDAEAPDVVTIDSGLEIIEPRQVDGLLVLVDGETGAYKKPTTAQVQARDAAGSSTCAKPFRPLPILKDPELAREGDHYIVSELQQSWFSDPGSYCATSGYGGDVLSLLGVPDSSLNLADDQRYWIGWSVLIPEDSPTPAAENWWVFAIHDAPGGSGTDILRLLLGPNLSWRVAFYDTTAHTLDFGEPALGVWQDFVVEVVMSRSAERGLFRLWHRVGAAPWTLVDDFHGATATDGSPPWMLFFGLYVLGYRDAAPARRILLDEIRVADERGSLELVAPGAGTLPRE